MKKFKVLLSFLFCLIFFVDNVKSTHIIGGELSYRCLDYDLHLYQFYVKLYRDCDPLTGYHAPFDSVIYVAIYDTAENLVMELHMPNLLIDTIQNKTLQNCFAIPANICIDEARYASTDFLPDSPGGYYMTYQRCCRSNILKNIVNPLNTGISLNLHLTDDNVAQCNSSPYFIQYPPTMVCVDNNFTYDHSAYDSDGDSLVYSLCEVSTINFISPAPDPSEPPSKEFAVSYNSPYSSIYPMDAEIDSLRIDTKTGLLTVTPSTEGNYVVAVCVSDYRNGKKLSVSKRDFQFNIISCLKDTFISDFTYKPKSDSLTHEFSDKSNSKYFAINEWYWDFGDGDSSRIQNPVHAFPDTGSFIVCLTSGSYQNCSDSICKLIRINTDATGINNAESQVSLLDIYPNPFSDNTTIETYLPTEIQKGELAIYDITGRTVHLISLVKGLNNIILPATALNKGVYIYKLLGDGNVVAKGKMVVY